MKIALLYVDAGKGHITPAKALSDAFEELGHTTVVSNLLLEACNAPVVNWMSKHNWRMMLHFPRVETFVNHKTDSSFNTRVLRFLSTHSHGPRDFKRWYEANKPDCIVVAHFLAANMIKPMVDKLGLQIPVFEYAADVFFTPNIGISGKLDKLYICTRLGKELSIAQGQPEHTISLCPFPLKKAMMGLQPLSKSEARSKLGLAEKFTVLLNLGGEGIGTAEFLEEVHKRKLDWQIIAVGLLSTSTMLRYKLFKEIHPHFSLHTPGFVDNIHEYICACDVQAGKAGANALMESLFLKRPFLVSNLLYAALPTKEFMNRHKVGWTEDSVVKQVNILQEYEQDKEEQERMQQRFAHLPLTFDSIAFAQMILSDTNAYYGKLAGKEESAREEKLLDL
ncbi:UDP-N-acetylglucosamine--LPS N-acetylglucosamine transferase [Sphaerochaeta sp. PS]|uniref:UDP-N-acetylglucosamine--LPS N-acetylglucosamine transferase n=1 Tax=Sphaerochaeta sp. PS TaxID=3076336 RepID=UPI0028A32167|nr:UDP-N-acetylglucosamine--LPS N-acetylglucosamine transferase [Sphaerochaeta sp. PS]MDT4761991.1 UDP-N-acetylglucosamine--LPS N-acetylglucosamine transferase [Sphaerochaeta sp. PS]